MAKNNDKKIRIAFVKFGGLAAGGTEKILQTIAANLPKDKFDVDYYYCDAAPYIGSDYKHGDTDPFRKAYMEAKGINLIKFNVAYKDVRNPIHPWIDTNFWDLFDENKYDILQTGRAGHPEYPFTNINKIAQVDLVTLPGMSERKLNVAKTIHISEYQANTWVQAGGDPNRMEVISVFSELPKRSKKNLRKDLGLDGKFVFGLHQRNENSIYSFVPLQSYSQIENENTAFVLLGGGSKYIEQAQALGLKNFHVLGHSGNDDVIHNFLATLDVYTHGRSDGETFSLAIAEAMYYGLPIVSHVAPAMGHKETIGDGGIVASSTEEYTAEMARLMSDKDYYHKISHAAKTRFETHLSLEANMKKFVKIYEDIVKVKQVDTMSDEDFWNSEWA